MIPIVIFPSILAGGIVSDIMFLAKKEFDSKLKTDEGTLSATGDLCTITASSGKDLYLGKAKVSIRMESNTALAGAIIELKANGVIMATWAAEIELDGDSSNSYEFVISGIKVAATQIIKLEAVTVDADVEVNGELVCFEETTGATPVI